MTATQNPRVTQADEERADALDNHLFFSMENQRAILLEHLVAHREAAEAASKAREAALVEALAMFVECARYQPHMGGHHRFMGWNQSDLRRAESHARATLAALTKDPDV